MNVTGLRSFITLFTLSLTIVNVIAAIGELYTERKLSEHDVRSLLGAAEEE
jgi:hypothetical protein